MRRSVIDRAVRSFLHKRPRTVLQAIATHNDHVAWQDAHVFWDAGFPVNAEKTAGYGRWHAKNHARKGA